MWRSLCQLVVCSVLLLLCGCCGCPGPTGSRGGVIVNPWFTKSYDVSDLIGRPLTELEREQFPPEPPFSGPPDEWIGLFRRSEDVAKFVATVLDMRPQSRRVVAQARAIVLTGSEAEHRRAGALLHVLRQKPTLIVSPVVRSDSMSLLKCIVASRP
jgi:hypothetical protein